VNLARLIDLYSGAYALVAGVLALYGIHAYVLLHLYARVRRRHAPLPPVPAAPPAVTVQLPIYNELYVAERLLAAAAAIRYPRDRFEIQVLDDSTDETTDLLRAEVARFAAQGLDVMHVRRTDRRGFKAGALRHGLARAKGELIAVFDADFVPPPDFLERTVPYFDDPARGLVQTRWGHLNAEFSTLTRAQALALDGHFQIEQTVRNRAGAFINFNGTAGIWRRRAIEDAGNWQDDTLTEDLDLSYRAQLKGWRFLFLPDVVCPAELPGEVNAFKNQQYRWARGSLETARKVLPSLLRAPLPWFTKAQAAIHLTNHLVYPLLLVLALSTLPTLVVQHESPAHRPLFRLLTAFVIASFGHPLLYAVAAREISEDWRRRLLVLPVIVAGGMGIAVNNTLALIAACRGTPGEFVRTPKYHLVARNGQWGDKQYRPRCSRLAALELALAAYIGVAVVYALATGSYAIVPFLLLYLSGFLYIGLLSVRHARHGARARARTASGIASSSPRTQGATA
jgi:cellulose synthase/poly-beta-1,6-N-acetylglucosamine synthase-like glycosyltransferase